MALLLSMALTTVFISDASRRIGAHWPQHPITRIASWRPIAFLGTFSYSLYLVHSPLQQLLWTWVLAPIKLGEFWTFSLGATVGTVLILVLSYWFYVVAERPFCG